MVFEESSFLKDLYHVGGNFITDFANNDEINWLAKNVLGLIHEGQMRQKNLMGEDKSNFQEFL